MDKLDILTEVSAIQKPKREKERDKVETITEQPKDPHHSVSTHAYNKI